MGAALKGRERPGEMFERVTSTLPPGLRALFVQEMRETWRRIGDFELLRALHDWEKMRSEPPRPKPPTPPQRPRIVPGSEWRAARGQSDKHES
jgi:hypothetical protein